MSASLDGTAPALRGDASLRELEVLVLDCQAGGATPAHGDLLELGWATCGPAGLLAPVQAHWIARRTERPIPRAVRELTSWSEACNAAAVPEQAAWLALADHAARFRVDGPAAVPTVIHFARFELPFLHDLHERLGQGDFPFDVRCLHAIAARLLPDLPRRNLRALSGYLGHSAELIRRSAGHVEASASIWRGLVPLLESAGVHSWSELGPWLAQTAVPARPARRVYPLPRERRRALTDGPGVYRMLRSNATVLYVGKAASVKKRIASHFTPAGTTSERALEMLTQVHEIDVTETASVLEAALLETDEIKRLDPPYNVQLRGAERHAWFAAHDLTDAAPAADDLHVIGPLPSQRALMPFAALIALAEGTPPSPRLCAEVLAVPWAFGPDEALFAEGWRAFAAEHLSQQVNDQPIRADRRIRDASRALWLLRGREEPSGETENAPPDGWDLARVRRRLERSLVQGGLLMRRARWLCLLADAEVTFRERNMPRARCLVLSHGAIVERRDLDSVAAIGCLPKRRLPALRERQGSFDATVYDRLRVLSTELQRVQHEGGEIAVRFGAHAWAGEPVVQLTRGI